MQIAWLTNLECRGWVEIEGQAVEPDLPAANHKLHITGLAPGTTYRYRLLAAQGDQRVSGREYTFTTPSEDLQEFVFCAYGDTRSDPEAHRQVIRALAQQRPRLVLHSGDLVADGSSLADWHHFFPVISRFAAHVPFYPCLGNHEGEAPLYYAFLPLPAGGGAEGSEWYATVFGSVQIIGLDAEARLEEQAGWLKDLLAQPRPAGVRWRVVNFHEPPYTSGPHPGNEEIRRLWCPLLEGGVDLVFCGHNHYYERSVKDGLNYVTVGGGGAPLYEGTEANPYRVSLHTVYSFVRVEVTPDALRLTALDTDQQVLDQAVITH